MPNAGDTAKIANSCLEVGDSWEGVQRPGELFSLRNSLGFFVMLGVLPYLNNNNNNNS